MIGRNALGQGSIAEHRRLLLIVSTHGSVTIQILTKIGDRHQAWSFSAACSVVPQRLSQLLGGFSAACKVVPFQSIELFQFKASIYSYSKH
jgi:hypothetical protein